MKKWIFKNKRVLAGLALGSLMGYGYYYFVGCTNGTCMISSKPINSTLYFGLMGGLFMSIFKTNSDGNSKT